MREPRVRIWTVDDVKIYNIISAENRLRLCDPFYSLSMSSKPFEHITILN